MTDFSKTLASLSRPRLLTRAARYGMSRYNRKRDLKRLTHGDIPPENERALRKLMALEADLELSRREGEAAYSPARHVDILSALMAEAKLWLHGAATA